MGDIGGHLLQRLRDSLPASLPDYPHPALANQRCQSATEQIQVHMARTSHLPFTC
jgi:hypothetical protein